MDAKETVLTFNECINTRDLEGLAELMAPDHTFIDSSDEIHAGKEVMVDGWKEFFELYPDYQNHFSYIEARGDEVYVLGYSTCAYDPLDGPAIWTARVEGGLVAEWRVYLDTLENRMNLNLLEDQGGGITRRSNV
jgi:ketosteroid isomerase-like protein